MFLNKHFVELTKNVYVGPLIPIAVNWGSGTFGHHIMNNCFQFLRFARLLFQFAEMTAIGRKTFANAFATATTRFRAFKNKPHPLEEKTRLVQRNGKS